MAILNGITKSPENTVAPCGLLSVADVIHTGVDDSHWVNGYRVEDADRFPTIRILTPGNDTVAANPIYNGAAKPRYFEAYPFFIEVEARRSGIDLRGDDNPINGILQSQIDAATQKLVEFEFWTGTAAKARAVPGANYLTQQNGAAIIGTGGTAPDKALALLEQSIAASPTGQRGVIHMTRDVASVLNTKLEYHTTSRDDPNAYASTRLGTLVVVGSGYDGSGPVGDAGETASATNKWIFATGPLEVVLGEPKLITTDVSQGFTAATNDSILQIERPASVHFDLSIWDTTQVTLP